MNRNRQFIYLVVFIICCKILVNYDNAYASMRERYPTGFGFDGLVELTYTNYDLSMTGNNRTVDRSYSIFQQRYKLGIRGYVYDRRLLVYWANITYSDDITPKTKDVTRSDSKSIQYDLKAVFLPYRPVTLTVYAMKYDYSYRNATFSDMDLNINNYGAYLTSFLRNKPTVRFEYIHQDVTSQRLGNTFATDYNRYWLNVRGDLAIIKTQYTFSAGLIDTSGGSSSETFTFFGLSTSSNVQQNNVANTLEYSASNTSKSFSLDSTVVFKPFGRLNHQYNYNYTRVTDNSDNIKTDTSRHEIQGFWSYAITEGLNISTTLEYDINKENESKWNTSVLSSSLSYSRPFGSTFLSSYYRFLYRKDEMRGDFTEHSATLNLATTRFQWGKVYTNASFSYLDQTLNVISSDATDNSTNISKGNLKAHSYDVSIGATGRIWKKAVWFIEGEYLNTSSNRVRPTSVVGDSQDDISLLHFRQNSYFYSVVTDIMYPLRIRAIVATIDVRAGYSIGKLDASIFGASSDNSSEAIPQTMQSTRKIFYHVKIQAPISRRLVVSAWWRENMYKVENRFDLDTREFELIAQYRIGKTFIDAECWVVRDKEGSVVQQNRRIMLKLRRAI